MVVNAAIEKALAGVKGPLYLGGDIGRKHDLTVFWLLERVGDVQWTRWICELCKVLFREQLAVLDRALRLPGLVRCCIDSTGIGGSQSEVQGDVWRTLLRADAQDISEVFQGQVDRPRLAARWPGRPVFARFELDTSEDPSVDAILGHAKTAREAGYRIDLEQLEERTGYRFTPIEAGGADFPGDNAGGEVRNHRRPLRNRAGEVDAGQDAADELVDRLAAELGVPAEWTAPVRDVLGRIEALAADGELGDSEYAAALDELATELPELFGGMDAGALADVFEAAMGAAALDGARAALSEQGGRS